MRLARIYVDKLFGIYKYDLKLVDAKDSNVTIIDAPNGMGKTTILELVRATLEGDISYIDTVPFECFGIEFDDGQVVEVRKEKIPHIRQLALTKPRESETLFDNICFLVNGNEYNISGDKCLHNLIHSQGPLVGREQKWNEDYDLAASHKRSAPDNLKRVLSEINKEIYYIRANRLYQIRKRRYHRPVGREEEISSVEYCRVNIRRNILAYGRRFANKSEELDRSFPQRVLNDIFKNDCESEIYTKDQISSKLEKLENQRKEFSELGLITRTEDALVEIPEEKELTDETKIFLTKYIEDNFTKLKVYEALAKRLKLLCNIVNERNQFSDKKMRFNVDKGIEFVSRSGSPIPIDKLSSGEKNNLVLFYELIFNCRKNSLILVDEPEISLHVAWQRQYIDELNEICELKGLQSIVATHSPIIVGNNFKFMVDLEDLSDGEV